MIRKKQFTLIILSFVVILLMAVLVINNNRGFRLISSTPNLSNKVSTITGLIRLEFSEDIDQNDDVATLISGDYIVNRTRTEGRFVFLNLTDLESDKLYTITFESVKSSSGKIIQNLSLSFETSYIPFNQLSKKQQELELSETDRNNFADPILAILPHEGDRFYIEPLFQANHLGETEFFVNIELYLTRVDLNNAELAENTYRERALKYLKSNDINPENYKIIYTVDKPPELVR